MDSMLRSYRFSSLIGVAVATLLTVSLVHAAEPDADRKQVIEHLRRTQAKLLKAVAGLSDAQWNFKAAPDRWSVAECLEHIAVSEEFIRKIGVEKALASPAKPEGRAERMQKDAMILKMIVDRSQKFKAPEPVAPNKRFATPAEALAHFRASRKETIALARNAANLRYHVSEHPAFKEADAQQWLYFLSGHSERHTLQIEEVMADADFPK
jgi:hypothetical protein